MVGGTGDLFTSFLQNTIPSDVGRTVMMRVQYKF